MYIEYEHRYFFYKLQIEYVLNIQFNLVRFMIQLYKKKKEL